ncbi:Mov34/MPN/PAD-1 family protein [Nocardioides lacusdianchii]|uniref:Mov34/MPN/PAD-1 family protein n=1 Tax=Nocardioides lacusdianchii TaxID=2783664 RepID=UPI001CC9CE2B|nr:Mov34/MPN/PAD-1 family protein [Nocardioides lacusdianchii]
MKAWVSGQVAAEIAHEAGEHEPLEAGGMLLGYWSGDDVVVTSCIASGPRTKRGTTWLVPDQEWQMARLGEVYEASGRLTTYLGDWHTHPGGAPYPSCATVGRFVLFAARRTHGHLAR